MHFSLQLLGSTSNWSLFQKSLSCYLFGSLFGRYLLGRYLLGSYLFGRYLFGGQYSKTHFNSLLIGFLENYINQS